MNTQERIAARNSLLAEARALTDGITAAHRSPTQEETIRFEELMARVGDLAPEETRSTRDELAASNEALAVANAATGTGGARRSRNDPLREMIASGESRASFAWPSSDEAVRSIANFSDSGTLWAPDFGTHVAVYARTMSPWLGLATVIPATDGRDLHIPQITGDPTTYTPGEGTAITPSDPTLGTATLTTVSYRTIGYISEEAAEDAEYNITDAIAQVAGRSIRLAGGQAFTTAIVAGVNNGGTATGAGGAGTATAAFFGYEDLIGLELGRAAPYRAAGSYVMSNAALLKVRKFRDQQGNYFFQPTAGGRGTINDFPIEEDPALAAPGSATKSVLFGDWRAALVIKATPIRTVVSQHYRLNTGELAIRVSGRFGLTVQDPAAAAYLVCANS